MSEWNDKTLPEKCRSWHRECLDEVLKIEDALNKYEKANPTNYQVINQRRESIKKLCGGLSYFSTLISKYEKEQLPEPVEFTNPS